MAVAPNQPNPHNNNRVANRFTSQGLLLLPPAPNPNNGIMSAPAGFPHHFNGGGFFNGGNPHHVWLGQHPPPQHQITQGGYTDDSDDDDDEGNNCPIVITITNPLHVKGDNNIVMVDPSKLSQRIATAIALSLRELSASNVPMITHDGVPRDIRVNVNAEVLVEGNKNIVGERAEIPEEGLAIAAAAAASAPVLNGAGANAAITYPHREGAKRKAIKTDDEDDDDTAAPGGLGIKMEPDNGDADDQAVKRPRLE